MILIFFNAYFSVILGTFCPRLKEIMIYWCGI